MAGGGAGAAGPVLVDGERAVRSVDETLSRATTPPDPRVVQSVLVALVLVDLVARGASGVDVVGLPLVGAALTTVLTVAAWSVPWTRVPPWCSAALAVADLLAVGLARLDPAAGGPVALAALPAYFLGRTFGRTGVAATAAGVGALVALPQLLAVGVGSPQNARLLTTSLIVVAGAQVAALTVARLRREREVASAIVDSVPVGVVLVDTTGRYVSMSPVDAPHVPLAYPSGSTAGEAHVYGADGTALARRDYPSARAARGEEFDGALVWVGDAPATRRALSVSARAVHDEHGTFSGASLACHDVTGLLHAHAVKDEFVGTVSHELRTPLTSVLGYLEIALERDDLDPGLRSQLAVSLRNARRLDGLVDDLLTTASDGARAPLDRSPTDLAALVGRAVATVRPAAEARGVQLVTDVAPVLTAHLDDARMDQVLDHLLANAVAHACPGGVVRVRAYDEATDPTDPTGVAGADQLVLEVTDDGTGLEQGDRDLVFTRFYRSERSRREALPGVGLGLTIVRDIVTAHGGRVEARSESGCGATFVVRVPMAGDRGATG